ncbi:MAG: hypothetical protein NVS3B20_02570 [Polyangiales bacterium]
MRNASIPVPALFLVGVAAVVAVVAGVPLVPPIAARAQADALPKQPPPAAPAAPDEGVLGTIEVNGSADEVALQKLALVPIITKGNVDTITQLVTRRDLELSGQFQLAADSDAPQGPFVHDGAIDLQPFRSKGIDILVRVQATESTDKVQLQGEVWLLASAKKDAVFTRKIEVPKANARLGVHRLTDDILEAITGRSGGFASKLAYTGRVGQGQQVFEIDADGFDLHGYGPATEVAIAPAFGPQEEIYYALSVNFSPFKLVHGPAALAVPLSISGSVLGVAFSRDRKRMALTLMKDGVSQLYTGDADGTSMKSSGAPPLAIHPVFGPLGKMAWVAGSPPRVYVDSKPVSPSGFAASGPTFCDSPKGLFVVFTVGVGKGADLVASDSSGGGLFRLTQNQGANSYPACSPDGRLIALFSTRTSGKGPGLYVMPIFAPSRAQRISAELGESLRWEAVAK